MKKVRPLRRSRGSRVAREGLWSRGGRRCSRVRAVPGLGVQPRGTDRARRVQCVCSRAGAGSEERELVGGAGVSRVERGDEAVSDARGGFVELTSCWSSVAL